MLGITNSYMTYDEKSIEKMYVQNVELCNELLKKNAVLTMVIRRSKRILLHGPPWRKDNKIGNRRSILVARTGQHREDTGVTVIVADRVDYHKFGQIVLVRGVIAMPSYHIEWRMILSSNEKLALELGDHFESFHGAILEPCGWREEVTWVG